MTMPRLAHFASVASVALAALQAAPVLAQGVAPASDDTHRDLAEKVRMHRCTVAALRGSYGFSVRGFTDASSGLPAPRSICRRRHDRVRRCGSRHHRRAQR